MQCTSLTECLTLAVTPSRCENTGTKQIESGTAMSNLPYELHPGYPAFDLACAPNGFDACMDRAKIGSERLGKAPE